MDLASAFQAAAVSSEGVFLEASTMAYDRSSIGGPFICSCKLEADGWITSQSDSNPGPHGTYQDDFRWLVRPGTSNADYEVRVTQNSGDTLDGGSSALNTWLSCDTDRFWSVTAVTNKTDKTANLTMEIRSAATGAVITSQTVTLYSENN
jgi:hypothetical protein